ncbi:MAG: hypothetical protein Q9227_009048 [Pyrenula ochraceoflavens]
MEDNSEQASSPIPPSLISSHTDSNDGGQIESLSSDLERFSWSGNDNVRDGIEELASPTELLLGTAESENMQFKQGVYVSGSGRFQLAQPRFQTEERKPSVSFDLSSVTDVVEADDDLIDIGCQTCETKPSAPTNHLVQGEPFPDRLLAALQDSPGHEERKGFFPRNQLDRLVSHECVVEELRRCFKTFLTADTIRKKAQEICGTPSFKKIFVILVLTEKIETILKFLQEGVNDEDLPLIKVRRRNKSLQMFDLGRDSKPMVRLECFDDWSSLAIRKFEEWQWTTLAPYFPRCGRKEVQHLSLQDQVVLPFIQDDQQKVDFNGGLEFGGGFSQVRKVNIHPEHHDFYKDSDCERGFAVKCLLSRDRNAFEREVEMLKKFSGESHPHLVSLLATYEQFKKFFLVFHLADADLLDYWEKRNPRPSMSHASVIWVAQQSKGIAEGLSKIHRYESSHTDYYLSSSQDGEGEMGEKKSLYGRHGDIKPANVLWFDGNDGGTLKLTDFGLAEFTTRHSQSYMPKSRVANTPTYRPPECDLENGVIGPSYDIWTLGCLYLEFITWLLGGWYLLEKFRLDRTSFDRMRPGTLGDAFFEIVKGHNEENDIAVVKSTVTDRSDRKELVVIDESHK